MSSKVACARRCIGFLAPVSHFKGGAERSLFDLMENPSIRPILLVPEEGQLSEEAAKRGITFLVVPYGNVSAVHRPLRIGTLVRALRDWLRAARCLAKLSRNCGIDIVHSNGLKAHVIAGLSTKLRGAPAVYHIRDIAYTRVERIVWRVLMWSSAHTVLVSHACLPGKAKTPENVSVIYNSIRQDSLQFCEPTRDHDETIVGICGRIHPVKGIHVALDWVAEAISRGHDVRLIIRGEAGPEAEQYVEELWARISALRLDGRVHFEGRKEGLAAIYGGLDLVLVPSRVPDPLPRAVMEAFALGLPVIGYPAGGIIEMIKPGENGWLADSADAFCAALAEIKSLDAQSRIDLKERCARAVERQFSRTRMFAQLNLVYDRVLEER